MKINKKKSNRDYSPIVKLKAIMINVEFALSISLLIPITGKVDPKVANECHRPQIVIIGNNNTVNYNQQTPEKSNHPHS
jgi:hypothetical protein